MFGSLPHFFVKTHTIPDAAMMGFFNVTPDFGGISKSCAAIYKARRG